MSSKQNFSDDENRFIGEKLLNDFGVFLANYNFDLERIRGFFPNIKHITDQTIHLEQSNFETITLLDLVKSNNTNLSKVLASLVSIVIEFSKLKEEAHEFTHKFIHFGEDQIDEFLSEDSLNDLHCTLEKLYGYSERCMAVINLCFHQLCALSEENSYIMKLGDISYTDLWHCIGDFFIAITTLDHAISKPSVKTNFTRISNQIQTLHHDPVLYETNIELVKFLLKELPQLEKYTKGILFGILLENSFKDDLKTRIKNSGLGNDLSTHLLEITQEAEKDCENVFSVRLWMQAITLIALQSRLFHTVDKIAFKRIIQLNKTFIAIVLCGNVMWYPEEFITKYVPPLSKVFSELNNQTARLAKLHSTTKNLPQSVDKLANYISSYISNIDKLSHEKMNKFGDRELVEVCDVLVDSIKVIKTYSDLIKWIIHLHVDLNQPVNKSTVMCICKMVELLKSFHVHFQKNWCLIIYLLLILSEHLSHKALLTLQDYHKQYLQIYIAKDFDRYADKATAIKIAEKNIKGPASFLRIVVAKLSLSISGIKKADQEKMKKQLKKIEFIISMHSIFAELCNCEFMYWHNVYMMPVYFSRTIELKSDFSRYFYMLQALSESGAVPGEHPSETAMALVEKQLLAPVTQIVETNLRIQTHIHLDLPHSDPYQVWPLNFNSLTPARLHNKYFDLKYQIEHYLSTMFYNLTTVVINNCRTYSEMRSLAELQYGLKTVEDNLPTQTLEQGLDVLEIMRNIDLFVQKYLYNLNNQLFIEQESSSKHLNTITISHVANSIRSHGIGIMNTTVNYIYQFLQKKFIIFSQFMFDEIIKSRLLKDLRYFHENKSELKQMYPFERAEKFNIGIRKLGLNNQGLSYLDLFRKLITQIGNALGFVRVIRSGGRRCLGEIAVFLPDLKNTNFLLTEEDERSPLSKEASQVLHNTVEEIVNNFSESTEYFKLLLNAFTSVFRHPQHLHLKNFFIIIPALTINYVEHSLTRKDRLSKKNKEGASFTDDGFAMGLAFILELLDQESQWNSLHWDRTIENRYQREMEKILKQRETKQDSNLEQTIKLSEKTVLMFKKEFALLHNGFNSAKVFFKA